MLELIQKLGYSAFVEVFILAIVIYRLLLLIWGTRAMQMVLGISILSGLAFIISQVYPLTTVTWIMDKFYSSILIIIVILFQEDIRRALSRMGKQTVFPTGDTVLSKHILDEITRAATAMVSKKIGALIVIERNIILMRYIDIGVLVDARISQELMLSIFHPTSPIHDGAVIIQQGRVAAAGCFLPLTRDEKIDPDLGTRHRAAIGMSQETDALVIVISEEKQSISLVVDGSVSRNLSTKDLRRSLRNLLSQRVEGAEDFVEGVSSRRGSFLSRFKMFRPGGPEK